MTLVCGGADKNIGFLVGDTLLNFDQVRNRNKRTGNFNPNTQALKIQILNSSSAVAFAGVVEAALEIINKLLIEIQNNPNIDLPEKLFQTYKNHIASIADPQLTDCEFLVLQIMDREKKLAKVTECGWQYCERAYIGDNAEYNRMMELRQTIDIPIPKTQMVQQPDGSFREEPLMISKCEIDFAEISAAMEQLTCQLKIKTVGAICGCITRVADARPSGELEYLQSIESGNSIEEGLNGYTYLSSNSESRGIGIYYRAGRMGFLFLVGDTEPNRIENADSLAQFIDIAQKKYKLNLAGGTWNT